MSGPCIVHWPTTTIFDAFWFNHQSFLDEGEKDENVLLDHNAGSIEGKISTTMLCFDILEGNQRAQRSAKKPRKGNRKELAAMANPPEPDHERPSTYVVQDRSNPEELRRLQVQEHLMTLALGGVLPEQPDPKRFHRVLDVACGAGGWLIELAKTVPTIAQLVGVDISRRMIEAAGAEAEAQQVSDRVQFSTMDALRLFALPDDLFDLTNMRFALSFLRTWEWTQVLQELQRVTRPGGVIRLTDADLPDQSSSPALLRLFRLLAQAYERAGKYFRPEAYGVADDLAGLLKQQNLRQVQMCLYRPEIRNGTLEGQLFFEDMRYLFRTNVPFLRKWIRLPDDYEGLYQQMLVELQQPDFVVSNLTITAWGSKPATSTRK